MILKASNDPEYAAQCVGVIPSSSGELHSRRVVSLKISIYPSRAAFRSLSFVAQSEVIFSDEKNNKDDHLLFWLSPGDLVYVPSVEEEGRIVEVENNLNYIFNIYKIVSFTGNRLYAIQAFVATSIVDKMEYSLLNKVEFTINENRSIKQYCIKIKIDRLGNILNI